MRAATVVATNGTDPDAARLHEFIRRSHGVQFLLLELPGGRIAEISPGATALLGRARDDLLGETVASVVRGLWRSEPMRLLLSGDLTSFTARSHLRVADGHLQQGSVWVRSVQTASARWLILVVTRDGEGLPTNSMFDHADDDRIVVGTGDGTGRIGLVSPSTKLLLGVAPETLVGVLASSLVHADDVPDFTLVITAVASSGTTRSVHLRLRHADGSWVRVRLFLARLGDDHDFKLAFTAVPESLPTPTGDPAAEERLTEVESRLRRIALELAAVGVTDMFGPSIASKVVDTIVELPPRQQEILTRLQGGERVPGIAQAMFLSQSTVRNHLSMIFKKFGVSSQEQLLQALREPSG